MFETLSSDECKTQNRMKLFDYRCDSDKIKFSKKIYAKNVENSLQRWLNSLYELDAQEHGLTNVKTLVDQGGLSEVRKVHNSQDTYFMTLTWEHAHETIFIHESIITPDFIADLNYFPADESGRKGYATSGYRPHIKFPFSKNLTSGEQVFLYKDKVFPGESARAQIRIVDHETFKNALYEGLEFEFSEGLSLIGTGRIVEIVNDDLKKN